MKKQTLLLPQLVALTLLTGCVTVTEGQAQKDPDPIGMAESRIALGLGYLENGAMIKA
ncbi:type IV pilus biogenesis/stability protein PilW, partial [Vibrio vulnificus]